MVSLFINNNPTIQSSTGSRGQGCSGWGWLIDRTPIGIICSSFVYFLSFICVFHLGLDSLSFQTIPGLFFFVVLFFSFCCSFLFFCVHFFLISFLLYTQSSACGARTRVVAPVAVVVVVRDHRTRISLGRQHQYNFLDGLDGSRSEKSGSLWRHIHTHQTSTFSTLVRIVQVEHESFEAWVEDTTRNTPYFIH